MLNRLSRCSSLSMAATLLDGLHTVLTCSLFLLEIAVTEYMHLKGGGDFSNMKVNISAQQLTLGPNPARAYLVEDWMATSWSDHRYVRFDLRQKTLSFTVDLSGVKCQCAGCLYLSLMPPPSNKTGDNYCGIQTTGGGPNGSIW